MADGSVPITAGSGTPVRALTNAGVQSGAYQQVMSLAGQDGVLTPTDPDGSLNVGYDPSTLYLDTFDTTLANWTTGGTAPTVASSLVSMASSTTASAASYLRTNGAFSLQSGAFLRIAWAMRFNTAAIANSTRWWGYGAMQASPTAAAPVLNGAVFQLDYAAGALQAAVYSAGTKTLVATLTMPTDGALHRYEIWYRQSVIYWVIDGVVVATTAMPVIAVTHNLYGIAGSINHTTAPSTAPTLVGNGFSISDSGKNTGTISDGVLPYLKTSVKAAGVTTATASSDLALVVAVRDGLPGGTNTIGTVGLNVGQATAYSLATAATTNAAVVKGSAGSLLELTVSNPTATAAYVKLYNKATAPTVGTDVPVVTIRATATGTQGDFQSMSFGALGKRFPLGIAIAVTAAPAASDTAVAVAGVQVHGSFV